MKEMLSPTILLLFVYRLNAYNQYQTFIDLAPKLKKKQFFFRVYPALSAAESRVTSRGNAPTVAAARTSSVTTVTRWATLLATVPPRTRLLSGV